jgi:phosphatidylinositol alpha-1,6-mannosyltransferase
MKIALITNNFLPKTGGITNVMVNVSKKLTELGENVSVLNKTYDDKEISCFKVLSNATSFKGILLHNIKFYYFLIYLFLNFLFFFKGFKLKDKLRLASFYCFYPKFIVRRIISIKNLVSHFKKQSFNIILSGTADISLLYSFILSKWFRLPIITIAHGDDFLRRYPFKIKEYIFQNIQKIVVTNQFMRKLFLKIYNVNPNNVAVIHLGVNIEESEIKESMTELREKFNISLNDFIILTVSRFYPRKGFETVLKTIRLIIDENPEIKIKYYIVGSGEDEKRIKNIIKALKLDDYVILLGSVDDYTKNQYYKLSNVFVLVPEIRKKSIEGFGIVYIEANFFKVPVIGSRSGGVRIAIENGKNGFLIEPRDEINLKNLIIKLYENEQIRKDLGEYGHNRVINSFNWSKNANIYRELLKNTIEEFK